MFPGSANRFRELIILRLPLIINLLGLVNQPKEKVLSYGKRNIRI
jgi:hypothetical protein